MASSEAVHINEKKNEYESNNCTMECQHEGKAPKTSEQKISPIAQKMNACLRVLS